MHLLQGFHRRNASPASRCKAPQAQPRFIRTSIDCQRRAILGLGLDVGVKFGERIAEVVVRFNTSGSYTHRFTKHIDRFTREVEILQSIPKINSNQRMVGLQSKRLTILNRRFGKSALPCG